MEQIKKVLIWLTINHPFFSSILLKRPIQMDESIPTACTDGTRIIVNPEWLGKTLSQPHATFVMVHEVMHIVYKHHLRRSTRDPQLWNMACDYAINGDLVKMSFTMPDEGLHDTQYDGMTAEAIYDKLYQEHGGKSPFGGDGDDPGGCGGVIDPENMSDAGKAQAEAEVNMDVAAAAEAAKSCGKMPGGIAGLIEDALTPKVDWRSHLWSFVNRIAKDDYSFQRLNKSYMQQGICVPDLYNEAIGTIGVIIDTSGSVSTEELKQFCGELTAIVETFPTTIEAVYVDTQVNGNDTFTRQDLPVKMNIKGRGGTCFIPGFKWLEENVMDYSCIIYMTDMECNTFPDPPHVPTLWVSTGRYGHGCEPPFGTVTYMG